MDVSIVIPSYNQEKTIAKSIDSVLSQRTNLHYEVIVVDSSNNGAYPILKKYGPRIKLVHLNKQTSCGKARNIGIKKAKANIIAFTDTDCVADADWLDNIYAAHKKYDVVGGRICNGNPHFLRAWSLYLTEFGELIGGRDRIVKNLAGCNVSYKRKIFQKYGYFQDIPTAEDFILHSNIREPMFFSRNAVVKHINRTNILAIMKHSFKLGTWEAYARRVNPDISGAFLLRYRFLIPLLAFYRFFLVAGRAIRFNKMFIFFLISPLIFVDLIARCLGFLKGTRLKIVSNPTNL